MSPSGSVVHPHGPTWPRTSASANTVKLGLLSGSFVVLPGSRPEAFTSDFEQQDAAASAASSPTRRNMPASIARQADDTPSAVRRLTGGTWLGRLPRSRTPLEESYVRCDSFFTSG